MSTSRSYNAGADLIDRNVAEGRGAKIAYIDASRSITYGGLLDECNRMGRLLADYEIVPETRVAMLVLDTIDFPVIFLGAIRAGVVPVALNTLLTVEQYAYILGDSRAAALFVSAPLLAVVEPILGTLPYLKRVFVIGGQKGRHLDFHSELAARSHAFTHASTSADDIAFWLYSSGSTGAPKGVRHVQSSLMATAQLYAKPVLGISEQDVCFSAAKLFFAYGLGNGLSFPLAVGATTVLLAGRPTPKDVFAILKQHQPTLFFGVPTLYAAILADPACTPENGSQRLKWCVSAGEALPEEVGKAWKQKFGVDILDGVGSTEMLHIYVSNRPGDVRYGTSGKPVPGYQIRLVDEAGADVPKGEVGEMIVRGATAADGYWNQREKSRRTFEGEWTRSGDKYVEDGEDCYRYCGRTDDMFKVSGIWVSPFEVESALVTHPAVLEAAVVPRADSDGLIKPRAIVVLKDGQRQDGLADALKEHVKTRAGAWKYPRWIEFVDGLPKTATGKIQRFKLRDS